MQQNWTLLSPYKEKKHFRTPSESIANGYTPTIADVQIKQIKKKK